MSALLVDVWWTFFRLITWTVFFEPSVRGYSRRSCHRSCRLTLLGPFRLGRVWEILSRGIVPGFPRAARRSTSFNESDKMNLGSFVDLVHCLKIAPPSLLHIITYFSLRGRITLNPPHKCIRQRVHVHLKRLSLGPNKTRSLHGLFLVLHNYNFVGIPKHYHHRGD